MKIYLAGDKSKEGWYCPKLDCWVRETSGAIKTMVPGLPEDCKANTVRCEESWVSAEQPLVNSPEDAVAHHDEEGVTWLGAFWRLDKRGQTPHTATVEPWNEEPHIRGNREMNLKRIYIQGQQCKIEDRVDLIAEITRHLRVVAVQKKKCAV